MWAVHPGRTRYPRRGLRPHSGCRSMRCKHRVRVLRDFGNMSSATVLFVLKALLEESRPGANGCAMSFGPGLTAETMLFKAV